MTDRSGQRLGNYRLLHLIGQGGFADVYLAEHIHLNTKAAIKVLQVRLIDSNLEQFRSEARIIANLAHPHIVRVLDFGVEDGIPFLVMEYAPYGTLRQRHPRGPSLPPVSILPYVEQVASALQYAHDRKLIHRDIKPENMLVGHQNDILLSDFGLVVVMQSTDTEKTGHMAGTVAYMAPEQLEGKPRAASDQYSLGIVIYEWLSGARPFQGSFFEIASQHILTSPTPLRKKIPALSPAVEEVVLKALEKEPQQRYTSVQEFATAFAQACQLERFSPTTYPGVNNPLNQPLPAIAPALSESETTPSIDPATLDSAATMPDSADISANPPTPQNDEVISPAEFQLPRQGISRRRIITGAGVTLIGAGLTWMGLSIFSPAPIFLHIAVTTSRSTSTPSTCPTTTSATPTPSAGPATPPPVTNTPVSLSDGLQYIDIKIGCGPGVQTNSNVSVEYTGWFQSNGKKFDSSYDRQASPFTFILGTGQVIKGFDEGLVGMKPGGIRRLIIPPALGYGSQGSPPTIPPNATLIFDVTLLNVH